MSSAIISNDFEAAAAGLLERFRQLWSVRDPDLIRQIVDPAGVSYWSGAGEVAGADYPERWSALVNTPGIRLDFRSPARRPSDRSCTSVGMHGRLRTMIALSGTASTAFG